MGRTVDTLDKLPRLQAHAVGDVKLIMNSAIPGGWGVCAGGAVSRIAYPTLYSLIGTTYGAGDGSTTFNLPDFRDRVPMGVGTRLLHERSGADAATLTRAQIPGWKAHTVKASDQTLTVTANAVHYITTSEGSSLGAWAAGIFSTTAPPNNNAFIGPSMVPAQSVPLLRKNLAVNFIIFLGN